MAYDNNPYGNGGIGQGSSWGGPGGSPGGSGAGGYGQGGFGSGYQQGGFGYGQAGYGGGFDQGGYGQGQSGFGGGYGTASYGGFGASGGPETFGVYEIDVLAPTGQQLSNQQHSEYARRHAQAAQHHAQQAQSHAQAAQQHAHASRQHAEASQQQGGGQQGTQTGAQPSDEQIQRQIHQALDNNPTTANSNIQAEVKNGTVTLTGSVRNRQAKMAATSIAWNSNGVQDVHNNVQVQGRSHQTEKPEAPANKQSSSRAASG